MPKAFINGFHMNFSIQGSGFPLILIHGLGLDQGMWEPQIEEFSRRYQVLAVDLRGHGQSESPDRPISIDLLADDLDRLLHFLGLRQASVLGLSLGGRIALRFALTYPREVRALILADAQSETPPEAAERFRNLAAVARREGMGKAAEVFFSTPALQGLAKRNPGRWEEARRRFLRTPPEGWANACLAIAGMRPLNDHLSGIAAPTLALAGEEDEAYLPYLDLYREKIPRCVKRLVPQASHMSNLENPEAFNEIVSAFLQELEAD